MVLSAYLRLLIFLLAILFPSCASSSPAFLMMYSAYKLNKQGDNIQPWRTHFPTWNQSVVPCPVLTVASWPAYRYLRRQVRWSGIPISLRIFHSWIFHNWLHFNTKKEVKRDFLSVYAGCSGIPSWNPSRNNLSYQSSLMKVKTKRNTGCLMEGFHNQASLISPQDSEGRDILQPLRSFRLSKTTRANLTTYSVPESFLLPPWDGDRALKLTCGINVTHLSKATS